jgi:hypothetical protein
MAAQVIAGLRCRKSKTEFLLRSLSGRAWGADELFTSEAAARPEAYALLSSMTSLLQRSSSLALAARCACCS